MAKEEMLNQNNPEKIMKKELAKKRAKIMNEFNVSRHEFSQWYVATVSPVVEWTNPVTAWMFAAWVHGSGVKEWIPEEEKVKWEARRVAMALKKAEREAKEAAEQEAREAKKAADAAARAEAEVKRTALKKEREAVNV
jgi:hypothetical protein